MKYCHLGMVEFVQLIFLMIYSIFNKEVLMR